MLDLLFSFRGRIGRLQYFLTGLVVGLVLIAGFVAIIVGVVGGAAHGARPNLGFLLMLVLMVLLLAPLLIWSGLALQAKRIRDIGLDPLIVIPLVMVLGVFDATAAQGWPSLAIIHGARETIFGLALHLAYAGCLLFWPGRSYDGGAPSPWMAQAEPDAPFPVMPVAQPHPVAQPQPSPWPTAPVRTGFGRRGL